MKATQQTIVVCCLAAGLLVISLFVSGCGPGQLFGPTPTPTQDPNIVVVTGKLLDVDQTPLPEYDIEVYDYTGGTSVGEIWDREGTLVNPVSKTNSQGKFTIQVPRTFLTQDQFVLGTRRSSRVSSSSRQTALITGQNGNLAVFIVPADTTKLDLGEIALKR
jgi:hypothetical protein